jgi:hypothetical protein
MQISRLVVCLTLCASQFVHANDHGSPTQKLSGHYYLEGTREVGSELMLRDSGKFEWTLMYGNQDFSARGTWVQDRDHVVLSTAKKEAPIFRPFAEGESNFTKSPDAGNWVAVVGVPHVGPLADVEVRFEAASGKTATAVSLRNGDAIVKMPSSEHWERSGFRRFGSTDPWQWISVSAERAKARLAGFAVANPESIQPPPFKSLKLRNEKLGLAVDDDTVGFRGTYVKH